MHVIRLNPLPEQRLFYCCLKINNFKNVFLCCTENTWNLENSTSFGIEKRGYLLHSAQTKVIRPRVTLLCSIKSHEITSGVPLRCFSDVLEIDLEESDLKDIGLNCVVVFIRKYQVVFIRKYRVVFIRKYLVVFTPRVFIRNIIIIIGWPDRIILGIRLILGGLPKTTPFLELSKNRIKTNSP